MRRRSKNIGLRSPGSTAQNPKARAIRGRGLAHSVRSQMRNDHDLRAISVAEQRAIILLWVAPGAAASVAKDNKINLLISIVIFVLDTILEYIAGDDNTALPATPSCSIPFDNL